MNSMFPGARFYKGALHCHTSLSDGQIEPQEMLKRYRERGYSFAAMTDHDYFAQYPEADGPEFLTIAGAELIYEVSDFRDNIRGTHVVQLSPRVGTPYGEPGGDHYERKVAAEAMNRDLLSRQQAGSALILAHPYWSYMDFADVDRVQGCFAVEIFNALCRLEGNSDSLAYWDYLLRRGKKLFGVAVDDHHNRSGDFAGGWVCVNADSLTKESIFKSLLAGQFYSSTGPEILDFGLVGDTVTLRCKPARQVTFVAYGEDCWPLVFARPAGSTESGEYALTGRERYVRAEVTGFDGSRAWTNPIFF